MIKHFIEQHASGHRFLSRKIVTAAQLYLNAFSRIDDYNIYTNGEDRLLLNLAHLKPRVVFDVGANIGDWAQAAVKRLPDAHIYAFELSPVTAAPLKERFHHEARVSVNALGLSNRNAQVEISHVDADSTLTTLYENTANLAGRRISAQIIKGVDYMEQCGLAEIDLLKIDTEGHDLEVIDGFAGALPRCHVIQFEYNELSWARGYFIGDFQNKLRDFEIGRLTAAGVLWDRSLLSNDRAMAGNMVAVCRTRADLIAALARFQ